MRKIGEDSVIKETRFEYFQKAIVRIAASFSLLLGFVVLFGWYTHSVTLIQVFPAFVPMQYNTALGFLLSGLGMLALAYGRPQLVLALGGLVTIIGSLTLIEYIFGFDLRIDQLLMEHYIETKTSHVGRMAPNTALCFTLTGIALLVFHDVNRFKWCTFIAGVLGSLVLGLGIIAFSGYLTSLESAYGWGSLTRMAVHTAIGFMVLGIGLFTFAWHKEQEQEQEQVFPYWLPVPIAIVVLTFSLSLWQALHYGRIEDVQTDLPHHFMLAFGFLLAVVLAITVSLAQKALSQAVSIEKARLQLAGELAERLHTESLLKESETKFRTIFDSSNDAIMTLDKDSFLDCNQATLNMFGYKNREDFLGRHPGELSPPKQADGADSRKAADEKIATAFSTGGNFFEWLHRRKNGDVFPASVLLTSMEIAGHHIITATVRDITQSKKIEAELEKQKSFFEAIFNDIPDATVVANGDREIILCNPALTNVFGYQPEDVLGSKTVVLYESPEEFERQGRLRFNLSAKEKLLPYVVNYKRKNGDTFPGETVGSAIKDHQGNILGFIGVMRDITKRIQAEEKLERLSRAVWQSPVSIVITNVKGVIEYVNPKFTEVTGYSYDEAVGNSPQILNSEFQSKEFYKELWSTILSGKEWNGEILNKKKNDELFWEAMSISPIVNERDEITSFVAVKEDITERKRAEEELILHRNHLEELVTERAEELRKSEASLTEAQYIAHMGNWELDIDSGKLSWSDEVYRIFGFKPQEFAATYEIFLNSVHPDDQEMLITAVNKALEEAESYGVEHRILLPDGTERVVHEVGKVLFNESGKADTMLGTVLDITEHKRTEKVLHRAKELAEAANVAKSLFLANMSHELRTPLNAILGFSDIIDGSPNLTTEQQENIGIIRSSGEHLLSLISEVLDMSKIESGRTTIDKSNFEIVEMLDRLESMFKLQAENKGLYLNFECRPEVPQFICTDEIKLRQILINLISNALKHTETGGVSIRVNAESVTGVAHASNIRLVFDVEDTGHGIPQNEQDIIFDAFVQAQTNNKAHEGTGLGLAISKQYVLLMGGKITVSSQIGTGTTFSFGLPVEIAAVADVVELQQPRRVIALEAGQPVYRILIADNVSSNRQLLIQILVPLGFEVREAINGLEAIEICKEWKPQLIFMDLRMPEMDGEEATKQIKATAKDQVPIVIGVTASTLEEDRSTILSAGSDDALCKPFRDAEIFNLLHKHLSVRFLYADEEVQEFTSQFIEPDKTLLAALPADLREKLQQASINGDMTQITQLLDQVRHIDPEIAEGFNQLVKEFNYERILELLRSIGT